MNVLCATVEKDAQEDRSVQNTRKKPTREKVIMLEKDQILKIVAERLTSSGLSIDENKLTHDDHFIDDLGGDDIDILDLVHFFEHELKIELNEDDIHTVGDLVEAILSQQAS